MNIGARTVDNVSILDLKGKLVHGEGSKEIRDKLQELMKSGQKNILLNLGEVGYMDSSGIGELVYAYAHVSNQGGQLKLLNLTQKLNQLLAITKLLTVFECFQNEDQALKSFSKQSRHDADGPAQWEPRLSGSRPEILFQEVSAALEFPFPSMLNSYHTSIPMLRVWSLR